ncbi:MAG TPA: RNA-binding S4 domain-containing protein [Rhizorhapis sp.]|nr:RNA-binding S4 domain-containing protein [Rhizorhapis sp.]
MAKALASQKSAAQHGEVLRIDKYLWFARLAKDRSIAQKMAEAGYIRVNGRRIDRSHAAIRPGDLITFPFGQRVRIVRVLSLPHRRGPAAEAALLYEEIVAGD